VIYQLPQTGLETVYIYVQSTTNKQTNTRSSFPPVFSSSPSVLGPPIFNRKRGEKNKQTKQQAEKQSKKKLQNPNPALAHILRGWRNGIKYRRGGKKKNCEQVKTELKTWATKDVQEESGRPGGLGGDSCKGVMAMDLLGGEDSVRQLFVEYSFGFVWKLRKCASL
jgi:hypothetical protein